MGFCDNFFCYSKRKSRAVKAGNVNIGGNNPVVIQSMTNTSTMDTESSIDQCERIFDAGADMVRLTAQGVREANNLKKIRDGLDIAGYKGPLVADIHFNPAVADVAAVNVEKVRINPGNYVDPVRTFRHFEYTDEEYMREVEKISNRFVPFLNICKENGTAIRLGVNHGSLSDRIMSRYGDTSEGMVESCMEFLRICVAENFTDVVISIKASNTVIMVDTVRMLCDVMEKENMFFPVHLGVTEAGEGEDGRIKSAIGIGSLLLDGIGDTIRVSLSEDPENEIPVAKALITDVEKRIEFLCKNRAIYRNNAELCSVEECNGFDPYHFSKRETCGIAGRNVPLVIADLSRTDFVFSEKDMKPDFVYAGSRVPCRRSDGIPVLYDYSACGDVCSDETDMAIPVYRIHDLINISSEGLFFVMMDYTEFKEHFSSLVAYSKAVLILKASDIYEQRDVFMSLAKAGSKLPVVLFSDSAYADMPAARLGLSLDFGPLIVDGFCDGVMYGSSFLSPAGYVRCLFSVLQAGRLRMSKTEYISCPGCGRTLYDLQEAVAKIKSKTSHLKNLKIGIMGCIVNGPGEMADADYGYVGAGRGKISLYKNKECVESNIPEKDALDHLIQLIKDNGDWI